MQERESKPHRYERMPRELVDRPQWVAWRQEEKYKVPVNPATLGNAGVTWPNTWAPFAQAVETAARHNLGLGFVLTSEDPYTCVDLDNCVGKGGSVSMQTRAILDLLAGWVELSPSGRGLHIWVKSEEPVNRRTQGIEVYSSGRWITVTGRSNPRAIQEIPERTAELAELVRRYFPEEEEERAFTPPPALPSDDEAIWSRLFASQHGSFFRALYAGDTSVCHGDHSRAVIMLANQLALMTEGDAAAIKRLLYQTGLVQAKWTQRRGSVTWIDHQIQDAIAYISRRRR